VDAKPENLKALLKLFSRKSVLVVGDVMSDEYIWGRVTRISPEAPIPVVQVTGETHRPGGAANVAHNLHILGAKVNLVGIIGADLVGKRLTSLLQEKGVDTRGLVVDRDRPTIQKTRVIAQNQQVVRIDRERQAEISGSVFRQVLEHCQALVQGADAVLLSDYAKGLLSPKLVAEVVALAKAHKKVVTADPKPANMASFKGVTLISPNQHEAEAATGMAISSPESLVAAAKKLAGSLECEAVLITRGEEGMSLYETKSDEMSHVPTVAKEVFDVSGAGDTVISTLTLGLAAGGSFKESARLANYAAGIVVGEVGVATVSTMEIEAVIEEK
jgi:D-beta-D-heptose 7-phosphate kinase/D-beta-D-heptose 1-phosphate adenosyltransferase